MSLKLNVVLPGGEKLAHCTIEVSLEAVGVTEGPAAGNANQDRINKFTGLVTQTLLKAMKELGSEVELDMASVVDGIEKESTVMGTPSTSVVTSLKLCRSLDYFDALASQTGRGDPTLESRMPLTLDTGRGGGMPMEFKVALGNAVTHCRMNNMSILKVLYTAFAAHLKVNAVDLQGAHDAR
ncbi:hypothetical protein EJ03DRAFT_350902 [Teratosphaeria nubilosa]|uniref:Uncharacterized protein n=1 Tax=Teratosphaeria nubilosa TaxID=161662 RepID=A0A6G1LAH7_9PEZI|nr:hypothetical protein EJ03DRAFT_350902 [Teratosphaeria nubilosa]